MSRPVPIDPERPETWPSRVVSWIDELVPEVEPVDDVSDLVHGSHNNREDEFRALLRGHPVRAFHATRLLDHEVRSIRREGIRALTRDAVILRIDAALAEHQITEQEAAQLGRAHVFATGEGGGRKDQVHLFVTSGILDHSADGLWNLLHEWGGEAIRMAGPSRELSKRITHLGRPAIVVCAIELSTSAEIVWSFPNLVNLFVATRMGLEGRGASIVLPRSVTPAEIVDIWQPGQPEYDEHPRLARD